MSITKKRKGKRTLIIGKEWVKSRHRKGYEVRFPHGIFGPPEYRKIRNIRGEEK